MALILAVGAGSSGIIDSFATNSKEGNQLFEKVEDAEDEITIAQNNLDTATVVQATAVAEEAAARVSYEAAVALVSEKEKKKVEAEGYVATYTAQLSDAQVKRDAALAVAQEAQTVVDQARAAVTTAQGEVDGEASAEKQEALRIAQENLVRAEESLRVANDNVSITEKAVADLQKAIEDWSQVAKTAENTIKSADVDAKLKILNDAVAELEEANSEVSSKSAALVVAQTSYAEAVNAYNEAVNRGEIEGAGELTVDAREYTAVYKMDGLSNQGTDSLTTTDVVANQTVEFDTNTGFYNVGLNVNAKQNETEELPSQTVFIVDESTSVSDAALQAMKDALQIFIDNMDENDSVAILRVADEVNGTRDNRDQLVFVDDKDYLKDYVENDIVAADRKGTTVTAMETALTEANDAFEAKDTSKNIVVLTDGGYTAIGKDTTQALSSNEVNCFAIGYGNALTADTNEATTVLNYFDASNEQMAESFKSSMSETAVVEILNLIDAKSKRLIEETPIQITANDIAVIVKPEFSYVENGIPQTKEVDKETVISFKPVDGSQITIPADGGWSNEFQVSLPEGSVASGTELDVIDTTTSGVFGVNSDQNVNAGFTSMKAIVSEPNVEQYSMASPLDGGVDDPTGDIVTGIVPYAGTGDSQPQKNEDHVEVSKETSLQMDEAGEAVTDAFENGEYNINLQAWSTKVTKEENPASIVLVLDSSGSLATQMNTVKSIANNFIAQMAGTNSEIAIVDFDWQDDDARMSLENNAGRENYVADGEKWNGGDYANGTRHSGKLDWGNAEDWIADEGEEGVESKTDKIVMYDTTVAKEDGRALEEPKDIGTITLDSSIKDAFQPMSDTESSEYLGTFIDSMKASGATALNDGLKAAEEILEYAKYPNQHVIVFTDGLPTIYNSGGTRERLATYTTAYEANYYAQNIAANNGELFGTTGETKSVQIHGVGYGNDLGTTVFTDSPVVVNKNLDETKIDNKGVREIDKMPYDFHSDVRYYGNDFTAVSANGLTGNEFLESISHVYKRAGDLDDLQSIFDSISSDIESSVGIASTITDEIDPRFTMDDEQMKEVVKQFMTKQNRKEPTTGELNEFWNKATVSGDSKTWMLKDEAEVEGYLEIAKNSEGNVTLQWRGSAAELTRKDDAVVAGEVPEGNEADEYYFAYDIPITSKEDYLGGNIVPSNVADNSKVNYNDSNSASVSTAFPEPYVNVHEATLDKYDDTKTIFVEEFTDVADFIENALVDWTGIESIAHESSTIGEEILNGADYIYQYPGTTHADGIIQVKSITLDNGEIVTEESAIKAVLKTLENQVATKTDIGETKVYALEFEYVPYTVESQKNSGLGIGENQIIHNNFIPNVEATNIANPIVGKGEYEVSVIAGTIDITKKITEIINTDHAGDAIFQFKIVKTDDTDANDTTGRTWYREVRIEDVDDKTGIATILEDLPKGTYQITELSALRYDFDSAALTNTEASESVVQITDSEIAQGLEFIIGLDEDQEGTVVSIYKDADVLFTNSPDDKIKQTDTDMVTNKYVWEAGELVVKQVTLENGNETEDITKIPVENGLPNASVPVE